MGTKRRPGSFDIYDKLEADEPMFVLAARDSEAPFLVDLWATIRQQLGENPEKLAEARQLARDMVTWRLKHRGE